MILKTDYTSYALIYSCVPDLVWFGAGKHEFYWLMSRTKQMEASIQQELYTESIRIMNKAHGEELWTDDMSAMTVCY